MDVIPYSTQSITETDIEAVAEVLRSSWLTQGPAVPDFEAAFAQLHDVKHAVAVSNATAGLHLACLALDIGEGKWVWTSPNSFVASANCALYCGASVDFVDIDPHTRNMCPEALAEKLAVAKRAGRLPTAVVPVHFAGLPCDMQALRALADEYGFYLIEDASHAVGARYRGAMIGSRYADISVFSFHPVKIITTGEGGMVTTQDEALAHRLRALRSHGITRNRSELVHPEEAVGEWYYEQHVLGFNYRLTDIQAALGSSQLRHHDQFAAARRNLVARYRELLADVPVKQPFYSDESECSWHLYVIEVGGTGMPDRAEVYRRLRAAGIGVNVHYIPIHLQPFYRAMGFKRGQFPNAEHYYDGALSIPLYPRLTHDQQDRVVREIAKAVV